MRLICFECEANNSFEDLEDLREQVYVCNACAMVCVQCGGVVRESYSNDVKSLPLKFTADQNHTYRSLIRDQFKRYGHKLFTHS